MNDLASSARSTDRAEREILDAVVLPDVRITTIDRLSLRLGLWLLLRSTRRFHRVRDHADHARLFAHHRATERREQQNARARYDRRLHL